MCRHHSIGLFAPEVPQVARSCALGRVVLTFRPMPPRMVLLRHGATEWSLTGQHTGRTDMPLLDEGREQAKRAGQLLHQLPFAQILTSPLQRARDTCTLAGFDGEIEPDLLEWDYGAYEGLTTARSRSDVRGGRSGTTACRRGSGPPMWAAGPIG